LGLFDSFKSASIETVVAMKLHGLMLLDLICDNHYTNVMLWGMNEQTEIKIFNTAKRKI
jgi:hypothetical protein